MTILKYLFSSIMLIVTFVAVIVIGTSVKGARYDCRLSEISPDFPVEVKQQCRDMYRQHYEQNKK